MSKLFVFGDKKKVVKTCFSSYTLSFTCHIFLFFYHRNRKSKHEFESGFDAFPTHTQNVI